MLTLDLTIDVPWRAFAAHFLGDFILATCFDGLTNLSHQRVARLTNANLFTVLFAGAMMAAFTTSAFHLHFFESTTALDLLASTIDPRVVWLTDTFLVTMAPAQMSQSVVMVFRAFQNSDLLIGTCL